MMTDQLLFQILEELRAVRTLLSAMPAEQKPSAGCVCPVGAEATCQKLVGCGRRPMPTRATFSQSFGHGRG